MGTYDSESRLIFSHFSRSTRSHSFAPLQNQIVTQFFVKLFCIFSWNFIIFCNFWINFKRFRADFDENLSEFHGIEKCFTKFRRNLKFWRIRGEGVAKKAEIISAKSLIFRSGGWPGPLQPCQGPCSLPLVESDSSRIPVSYTHLTLPTIYSV